MDGVLDEAVWARAAVLTGFSQFSPVDGVPAADSTEVLVWYSPTAIYFGIRAFETHGAVHATLADRDRIGSDDHVQILLSTFNDARQATVFAVNPFGVQSDGALVETGATRSGNGFTNAVARREMADLSPDYVFDSKGRITDYGYEVEVRIPFKSLRYQSAAEQIWGLNVTRRVQHSGYEDSWTPARRASASFLAQSGRLVGLTDLHRGLVLDFTPSVTSRTIGQRLEDGTWDYSGGGPELGGTLRWGVTNNLTLNGTANPDFSQVESDAGQLLFDPRDERFLQEKRPFFLDGIEQFTTPNNLIYSRRIVQPSAAVKLTGKAFSTDIALLSAIDDREVSLTGEDHPFFNILRVQRDIGSSSRVGRGLHRPDRGQRLQPRRRRRCAHRVRQDLRAPAPAGRQPDPDRRRDDVGPALAGALQPQRPDARHPRLDQRERRRLPRAERLLPPARTGAPQLRSGGDGLRKGGVAGRELHLRRESQRPLALSGVHPRRRHPRRAACTSTSTPRCAAGWQLTGSLLVESFGYPYEIYTGYRVELPRPDGSGVDTVGFVGRPRIPNRDYVISFQSPEFEHISANAFVLWGNDENFFEWSPGRILIGNAALTWRPTDKLRLESTYAIQQVRRRSDGSLVNVQHIPRLKVEYQLSRPIFFRAVGEYATDRRTTCATTRGPRRHS